MKNQFVGRQERDQVSSMAVAGKRETVIQSKRTIVYSKYHPHYQTSCVLSSPEEGLRCALATNESNTHTQWWYISLRHDRTTSIRLELVVRVPYRWPCSTSPCRPPPDNNIPHRRTQDIRARLRVAKGLVYQQKKVFRIQREKKD